jgi:4-aminobutyrate aminotransferase-like enzyme
MLHSPAGCAVSSHHQSSFSELCSLQVGTLLLERMRGLQEKHSIIGDVRGQGLMLGMEMVKDRTTKEPAAAETAQVWSRSGVKFLEVQQCLSGRMRGQGLMPGAEIVKRPRQQRARCG